MSEQQLSPETFFHELVNRFFHPNSYFFRCLDGELEALMVEVRNSEEDEYLLLGNLVDWLVAADDAATELEKLDNIEGFAEFGDKLRQGVRYLFESDIDSEKMKIEIEGLAHSMFNSALLAMQDPDSVRELGQLLGVSRRGKMDIDVQEIHEQPSAQFLNAEPEQLELDASDVSQRREEAFPHVDFDADKAFTPEASLENEKQEAGSSKISEPVCQVVPRLSEEPNAVFETFQQEMQKELSQLEQVCRHLESHPDTESHWQSCDHALGSIAIISVISGFEAFEHVAGKARRVLRQFRGKSDFDAKACVEIATTAAKMMGDFLQGHPEEIDSLAVKEFTVWLQEAVHRIKNPSELSGIADESQKSVEGELACDSRGPDSDDILLPEQNFEQDKPSENVKDTTRPENFQLPGEDDDEILGLIAEISSENAQVQSVPATLVDEVLESASSSSDDKQENQAEDVQAASPNAEGVEGEVAEVNEVHLSEDDRSPMSVYKQQAELYFGVIDEALETLQAQRHNMTALEDLELASNALYGLALKLNLDEIGIFPDKILTLMKNTVATNYVFTDVERKLIKDAFAYFRGLNNFSELKSQRYKDILGSLNDLNACIKERAHGGPMMNLEAGHIA